MLNPRDLSTAALVLFLGVPSLGAQDFSRYRDFTLGASLDAVVAASGARADEAKTLHQRPATIQELEWRSLYGRPPDTLADPVRQVVFTFYEDQLYRIVVSYDRERTAGLTPRDLVEALSSVYGSPAPADVKATRQAVGSPGASVDHAAIARWDSSETSVTLLRANFSPDFTLVVLSKRLGLLATSATEEAIRLDAAEAPQRAKAQRAKDAADALSAQEKARAANVGSFRP